MLECGLAAGWSAEAGARCQRARLDTVLVAQPSRRRVLAASRCECVLLAGFGRRDAARTRRRGSPRYGLGGLQSNNLAFKQKGVLGPSKPGGSAFGFSAAAVGTDRVLIGALYDNTGAPGAGAAYLFSLDTPPSVSISLGPQLSNITVSWSALAEGWVLERTNALPSVAGDAWPQVPPPYQTNAGTISVAFTNNPATGNQFFRLHKP